MVFRWHSVVQFFIWKRKKLNDVQNIAAFGRIIFLQRTNPARLKTRSYIEVQYCSAGKCAKQLLEFVREILRFSLTYSLFS